MTITTIIILSILSLLLFLSNIFLFDRNNKLISEKALINSEKNKLKKEIDNMVDILPGSKVVFKQNLTWAKTTNFSVLYEANVVAVTETMFKVNAYDFTSDNIPDNVKSVTYYKKDIIRYMQNKWIERKDASHIFDEQFIRDSKIDKII